MISSITTLSFRDGATAETDVNATRPNNPLLGCDQYSIQHVGIEDAGIRYRGESQGDQGLIPIGAGADRKAEDSRRGRRRLRRYRKRSN